MLSVTFHEIKFSILYVWNIHFYLRWYCTLWLITGCPSAKATVLAHGPATTVTHSNRSKVRPLSKWSCTAGPGVTGGRYSQSQAVFEVWRVNTMAGLSCHLLCLFSQHVTQESGWREYSISVSVHVCVCIYICVPAHFPWCHYHMAGFMLHSAHMELCNARRPLDIQPNARRYTCCGNRVNHALTWCNLPKWSKAINYRNCTNPLFLLRAFSCTDHPQPHRRHNFY